MKPLYDGMICSNISIAHISELHLFTFFIVLAGSRSVMHSGPSVDRSVIDQSVKETLMTIKSLTNA